MHIVTGYKVNAHNFMYGQIKCSYLMPLPLEFCPQVAHQKIYFYFIEVKIFFFFNLLYL